MSRRLILTLVLMLVEMLIILRLDISADARLRWFMLMLILILKLTFPQRVAVERMEKLGEQLEEARKLRQSIFRRGDAVFAILARSV